jgi:hypothetical protein
MADKENFKLFIGTQLAAAHQWYESGHFTVRLPTTLVFTPGQYMVSVNSLSMDFSPINIDTDCKLWYNWIGQRHEITCDRRLCDIIKCLISELNQKLPGVSPNKPIRFTLDEGNTRKVKMTVRQGVTNIRFSLKLATLLGFDDQTAYAASCHAERLPDVYYYFCPLVLCSRALARPCFTPTGSDLPILRPLKFEGNMTAEGRRVVFNFEHEKRWVPLMNHQLQEIDVYVMCSDFKTSPSFLRNSGGCVIELEFKRQKLSFV